MSRDLRCHLLSLVLASAGFVPYAQAVIVEATFSGEVTFVDQLLPAGPSPFNQIQLADPFTLRYLFDSETPNLGSGGSIGDATGRYAIQQLETTIGAFHSSFSPSNITEGQIAVSNRTAGHSYLVAAELPESFLAFGLVVAALLEDSTASAFSNISLPLSINLSHFDSAALRLEESGRFVPPAAPRLFVEASILSFQSRIIPEPTPFCLALTAVGLLFWRLR